MSNKKISLNLGSKSGLALANMAKAKPTAPLSPPQMITINSYIVHP